MKRFVFVLGLLGFLAGRAPAASITYVETVTASGTLGGSTFTNAALTFTQTADTASVTNPSGTFFIVPALTSTFTVAGLGSGTITTPTGTFVNFGNFAGLLRLSDFVFIGASPLSLSGYDLKSSVGPVSGTPSGTVISPGLTFATTAGSFNLASAQGSATFQATLGTAAVPEPSSWVLASISGVFGLGLAWLRRRSG